MSTWVGTQRNTWMGLRIWSSTEMAHARYNQNLMHMRFLSFSQTPLYPPACTRLHSWVKRNLSDIGILSIKIRSLAGILKNQFHVFDTAAVFKRRRCFFWTVIRSERGFSMKQPDYSPEASIELWGWSISFEKHPRRRYTVPVNNFAWPRLTNHCFDSAQISKCSAVTILLVMFRVIAWRGTTRPW